MNGNLNVKVFLTEKPKQAKIKQKVTKMVKDGKNLGMIVNERREKLPRSLSSGTTYEITILK